MPIHEINGCPMHYHISGDGIPLLFIHPPLLTKAIFAAQTADLSTDYQVITYDIRGHGHSGYSSQALTYSLLAEDILRLMDYLELDSAYLCGYSTGGSVALHAMLSYPDRFRGAVLISSMPEMTDWYNRFRLRLATALSFAGAGRLLAAPFALRNSPSRHYFSRLYKEAVRGYPRNWRDYFRCSLSFTCSDRLGEIKHPVMLLYGSKDRPYHRYARVLRENLPAARLFTLAEKHPIPSKASRSMNGLIRRWTDQLENGKAVPLAHGKT
ncbi:alpha/beta fold hydrolase [Gorillibacterium massiliense]|uniref:alpha/beta fold hydrolase n=1 Tax=Gorillibacterium massiliense TaxID=1280390 RepID=UPI0004B41342|nr:alpha/beta hydrolase [Gorillibacterium massiliense]